LTQIKAGRASLGTIHVTDSALCTAQEVSVDVTYFKNRLLSRKAELSERLTRIEKDLDAPKSNDDDDRAIEKETDEVMEALGDAGLVELRAIDAALDRIDNGHYGVCLRCGESIAEERLEAVPHAVFCIACREEPNN
jgi:RNA polymerase-binding protein DksA